MRKQNSLKLLLCTFLMCIAANVWGAEYSFTIQTSDFNTTSYVANNGSHDFTATCTTDASKTMTVACTSNQVYQNSGKMQWQKSNGYIYNTTDLGTITSVTVNSTAGTFTTYYGTTAHPTSGTTVGNGYFTVKVGSATGYTSSIVIVFEIAANDPTKTATTTAFAAGTQEAYTVAMDESFTAPTATTTGGAGLAPTYSSSNTAVATVNATTGAVTMVAGGTTTITAAFAGDNTYAASSASYSLTVVPVFNSLEALVAADLATNTIVKVTFENVAIKSFATSGSYRNGVFFDIQKGGKDIEIYYRDVPAEWVEGGTLSGTMTCPWKLYNGTWELAPDANSWAWTNLTYTAPAGVKIPATITATAKTGMSVGEAADEYEVSYTGDGALSVTSSNEAVATAVLVGTTVTVTPLALGTTTITISAPETENYLAAQKVYTLTVSAPHVTFDLSKDETTTANADKLEWVNAIVTMTADKANATVATNNYYPSTIGKNYNSTRFYSGSTLTFDPATGFAIDSIKATATSENYANTFQGSTWTNATASVSGTKVTVVPTAGTSNVVATIGGTCGFTSIEVYYSANHGAPTSLEAIETEQVTKFMQNGQVFIVRDGEIYNALGQKVK